MADEMVKLDLIKCEMHLRADKIPNTNMVMQVVNSDTEELKNVEITFQGDRAIFKIGEGE